jgi:ABC-type sugar transport system ATPase subunit
LKQAFWFDSGGAMAAISLSKLNKHYGSLFHAVKDVDLEIADKEFVALVGPSGCGKSTTLRMIAGLEDITSGDIRIGDRLVNNLPPRDRDIAMVFQNYALYQHMSVYDNLAFGLRNKKTAEAEIKADSSSASRSAAASCATRRCSCSTSRYRTWMPSCAPRCVSRSSACMRRFRPRRCS